MTAPLLAPGSMLGSRWIVGGRLAQSETTEVYEAEATSERRFAAIKLFARACGREPAWSDYAALTRTLSELPGDGLARAYDLGIDPNLERPYVASERLTFPTVAHYVSERRRLPLRALAQALTTLAGALDAAHAAGIVHGGLKPQNVFVSFDNPQWARLTDFGVARLRHAAFGGPAHLLGWSAPEGATTAAADRYALALVCFFGVTGFPWLSALRGSEDAGRGLGSSLASERARSQGSELDPSFDAWFARALHADPAARFASAREMASAFVEVFANAPTTEMAARPSFVPLSATLPLSATPPLSATLPLSNPPARPSSFPPASSSSSPPPVGAGTQAPSFPPPPRGSSFPPSPRGSSFPPSPRGSSFPPDGRRSSFPLSKPAVPSWFWFACAGMALVAVLAIFWLSRY